MSKTSPKSTQLSDLEKIIALMPGNVYWKSKEGYFLGCNQNVATILKLPSPAAIVGKTNADLFDKDLAKLAEANDQQVMADDKELVFEEQGLDIYGNPATYFTRKVPLHNEKNEVIGILGISIDITERKKMEEALLQEKEKAEIANRAKSEFIMNMGHDLRTPFSGLLGLSEYLQQKEQDPEKKYIINDIVKSGKNLLTLINDILELANIENTQAPNTIQKFNIRKIVRKITSLLHFEATRKNIKIKTTFDPKLPLLLTGEATKLSRIILNLVNNAIKFTKVGTVAVDIKAKDLTLQSVNLMIAVTDSGIGIPAEKFNYIFERFTKLTSSYQYNKSGMGVGLYIVNQFIKDLHGTITVNSTVNQGSTFTCTIPFPIASAEQPTKKNQSQKIPPPNDKKFTVLLVEDDLIAGKAEKLLLETYGFIVTVATTGAEAIALSAKKFDLILMDVGLPDKNGFEVAEYIRAHCTANKTTKIIALTAHVDKSIDKNQNSVDAVRRKPLSVEFCESLLVDLSSG